MGAEHEIRIILRGDDCGGSHSANQAIMEACGAGTIRNVSLMAVGPAIEEAARMFAGRTDVCFGLHLTMNAEWDGFKWRPVLPQEQVPDLVDHNGYLLPAPAMMAGRGGVLEQVIREAQAQLDKLRALGFQISYADEHMFFGFWVDGFHAWFEQWCKEEKLVNFHRFNHPLSVVSVDHLPDGSALEERLLQQLEQHFRALERADKGTYTAFFHPGLDSEEMRRFENGEYTGVTIAAERDMERRMLIDPRFKDYYSRNGIQMLRYDEA